MFLKTKRIYENKIDELRNEINSLREQMMTIKNEPSNNQQDEDSLNTILKLNFKNTKNFKIDQSSKLDTIASTKL